MMPSHTLTFFSIDIHQEYQRKVIFTATSQVMKVLALFMVFDSQCHCISEHFDCGAAHD
jgi:hypothetical protein